MTQKMGFIIANHQYYSAKVQFFKINLSTFTITLHGSNKLKRAPLSSFPI